MQLTAPKIIAPDSSHWIKWIDAALHDRSARGDEARHFHDKLLCSGWVPFLSLHHTEELLTTEDVVLAQRRVAFIQNLPMVAFLRLPAERYGAGTIVDILAAEVAAMLAGASGFQDIITSAKRNLFCVGPGSAAIGDETWIWTVLRPEFKRRQQQAKLITAAASMSWFDDHRTIGELSRMRLRTPDEIARHLGMEQDRFHAHILAHGDKGIEDPKQTSVRFLDEVERLAPSPGMTVRQLLEVTLMAQGVERSEIRDECRLGDLNALALFRQRLKVVAEMLERPVAQLKHLDQRDVPSLAFETARLRHTQKRRAAGSDLTDGYLAVLALYIDRLCVDKRTEVDLRLLRQNEPSLAGLMGEVRKAKDFPGILP